MQLTSSLRGDAHHVTVPAHPALRVGTLSAIVRDVSAYVGVDRNEVVRRLFGS